MVLRHSLVIAAVGVVFFCVYSFGVQPYPQGSTVGPRFDWPDETANHFWITHFAATNNFVVPESLNQTAENQIHPRSINVRGDGSLVPGSFLGLLLLYGLLAKIIGGVLILYVTPLLAVVGAWALYVVIAKLFDEQIGLVSAILLLIYPGWWYYASTPMLPNVPFLTLLLLGIAGLFIAIPSPEITQYKRARLPYWVIGLSGLIVGVAISIRPAEALWVIVALLGVVVYLNKYLTIPRLVVWGLCIAAMLGPTLLLQQQVYGGYFATGYAQLHQAPVVCTSCEIAKQLTAPFGINPELAVGNFWNHFIVIFAIWNLLTLFGVSALLSTRGRLTPTHVGYLLVTFLVSAILIIYYGSWQFTDQLTVTLNNLGVSYVRYWLPISILSLPLLSLGVVWVVRLFSRPVAMAVVLLISFALAYYSGTQVLFAHPDSIVPVRERIANYKTIASKVTGLTEDNAVIVTVRKDKVFFPERRVIHSFESLGDNQELVAITDKLLAEAPVYYYALAPLELLDLTASTTLRQVEVFGNEVLYKLERL